MKSESKKFEPKKEEKPILKRWFISYEIWQYINCFVLTEKKGQKVEAESIERAIDSLKPESKRIVIISIYEL